MKELKKNNKGITLIALIITIVVMLILAGVTINLTLGENGIFTTAQKASEEHIKAQLKEELELEIQQIEMNKIIAGQEMQREDLKELSKIGAVVESTGIPAIGEYKDYAFEVDENYKVTIGSKLDGVKPEGTVEIIEDQATGITQIKVTASTTDGSITNIEATNGAVLKTDTSATEKIFEVTEAGTYYFKITGSNGRVTIVSAIVEISQVQVTEITLNKTSTIMAIGDTETLLATITPANATNPNLTWTSSDETVATVSDGTITAKALGTATITAIAQDGSGVSANCTVTVNPTLTSQITGEDYGKAIDYSVTVEGTVLEDWRVFYNDKTTNNVYIIYDGYLPNTIIPTETGMTTTGTYQAYWDTTNFSTDAQAVATLTSTTYWSAFAEGVAGATATGGPTNEMFVNSWNENPTVNSKALTAETSASGLTDSSKLYIPYTEAVENCNGYWLASPSADATIRVWSVACNGDDRVSWAHFSYNYCGVRPLVCLPSGITGTVGTSVSIDK